MKFKSAVVAMSKGAFARRRSWVPGRFVRFSWNWESIRQIYPKIPETPPAGVTFPFLLEVCPIESEYASRFSKDDDKADDWELIEFD